MLLPFALQVVDVLPSVLASERPRAATARVGSKCSCHQLCLHFASWCPRAAAQAAVGVGASEGILGTVVVFSSTLCPPHHPAAATGVPMLSFVPPQLPPFLWQLTCPGAQPGRQCRAVPVQPASLELSLPHPQGCGSWQDMTTSAQSTHVDGAPESACHHV